MEFDAEDWGGIIPEPKSYGGTESHDHHILLVGCKSGIQVRYSRCPRNLSAQEIYEYYANQVQTTLRGYILVHVIEDLGHIHPRVIDWHGEYLPNGLDSHMP